jgi:hypothetical protein
MVLYSVVQMELLCFPTDQNFAPEQSGKANSPMQGSVPLDSVTNHRLVNYADLTGTTVSAVANEAMNHWMDTIGDTILEELDDARRPIPTRLVLVKKK